MDFKRFYLLAFVYALGVACPTVLLAIIPESPVSTHIRIAVAITMSIGSGIALALAHHIKQRI